METSLTRSKTNLESKVPDIEKSLEMLDILQRKKEAEEEMETDFLLADNVYVNATVSATDKVSFF